MLKQDSRDKSDRPKLRPGLASRGLLLAATQLVALLSVGCATSLLAPVPQIPMSGPTVADRQLKRDVLFMLPAYAQAVTGCQQAIDSITTEIVHVPPGVAANEKGQVTDGAFVELWSLDMCEQREDFYVTFVPDGKGSSMISLSREFQEPKTPTRPATPLIILDKNDG